MVAFKGNRIFAEGYPNPLQELTSYSRTNANFSLSFSYPKSWYIQERATSTTTPFAVLISDQDLDGLHQGYPDKFINVVYYKTNQSPAEYATSDLVAKKIQDKVEKDIEAKSGSVRTYESSFKSGKYFSAYKRSGDYLLIIESYVKSPKEMGNVFAHVVSSLEN